jgi:flagellar capping protein FliD
MLLEKETFNTLIENLRKVNSEEYEDGVLETLRTLGVPSEQVEQLHQKW